MISRAASRALAGTATAASIAAAAIITNDTLAEGASPLGGHASPKDDFVQLDLSKFPLDHHLLHNTLQGEDKLEEYELSLSKDRQRLRAHARLGALACGHPHIIHGGAISSLLDDSLGTLFMGSGFNGFTANLSVNFRKPLPAGTNMTINAAIDRVELSKSGNAKVYLKAVIVDAENESIIYSDASALFISKSVPASDKFIKPLDACITEAADAGVAVALA